MPDLSPLTPYAFLGNNLNLNLATVNGNVGISANGTIAVSAPSGITGRLDLDSGVNTTGIANGANIGGHTWPDATAVHTGVDLSTAQSLVDSASSTLQGYSADYTLGDVTSAQTFGPKPSGGVTVVDMNSVALGGSNTITLNGSSSDYFVVNVANGVDFTGSSGIFAGAGGIDPSHILLNFYSSSLTGVVADINTTLQGTMFVPYSGPTFHSVNGAIFGGDQQITLMSGATLTTTPFSPPASVPEPSSLLLMGAGVVALVAWRRRISTTSTLPA